MAKDARSAAGVELPPAGGAFRETMELLFDPPGASVMAGTVPIDMPAG